MFAGRHINTTEDRAVLHVALRMPAGTQLEVDGQDVVADVHRVLDRMGAVAARIRSGEWTGATGQRIRAVVNIGIGGSDLGPAMAHEALFDYATPDIQFRFVSNIDPVDLFHKTHDLDPAETLFVVSSKTFTTLETLTNAAAARQWLLDGLGCRRRGGGQALRGRVHQRGRRSTEFGIDPANMFGFWDWVGGRYSYDSAIGFSLMVAIGPEAFAEMLAGFHAIDQHFASAPARGQPAGHPGHAQRLVRQPVRGRDPRRAALQPAAGPVPRLPAAADHGVQRQVGPTGRLPGLGPDRGDLLGGARHQRAARLLPAHPPGDPAHPGRLHRLRPLHPRARRPAGPADGQLLRPGQGAGLRQDGRGGGRRGHRARGGAPQGDARATTRARPSWPRC